MNSNYYYYKVFINIDRFYQFVNNKRHVFEVIVANKAVKYIPP